MQPAELKELQDSISILTQKIDRLSKLMLPQEEEPETDLDRISQKIAEQGLDPVEALREAGILQKKRRRGRKKSVSN